MIGILVSLVEIAGVRTMYNFTVGGYTRKVISNCCQHWWLLHGSSNEFPQNLLW
jgi:hypothetical protein